MEHKKPIGISAITSCGVEFVSAVAVAVILGVWLDRRFDLSPLFLVVFFILGCLAGYVNVLRHLQSQDEPQSQDKPQSQDEQKGSD
ncbi:MAG: AtpZ/AtpI family protein [Holosporaceae bacterium]|jgi:ATP synthase protein I|nr:AtpZ/AtpI family protein [Holosporaceae bacterium]